MAPEKEVYRKRTALTAALGVRIRNIVPWAVYGVKEPFGNISK
jgi:hypothetical protein